MQVLPVDGDVSVREFLTAGGLRGSTLDDMVPAAPRVPAVGDRVIVDVHLIDRLIPVEVIVAQVHDTLEGPEIIGRPEGTLVTAFASREWREVPA